MLHPNIVLLDLQSYYYTGAILSVPIAKNKNDCCNYCVFYLWSDQWCGVSKSVETQNILRGIFPFTGSTKSIQLCTSDLYIS